MIKLKSLFRRGQGPSGSKNSSTSNSYRNIQQQQQQQQHSQSQQQQQTPTDNENNSTSSPPPPSQATQNQLSKFYETNIDNLNQNNIVVVDQDLVLPGDSYGGFVGGGVGSYATLPSQHSFDNNKKLKNSKTTASANKKYKQPKPIPNSNSNSMPGTTTTTILATAAAAGAATSSSSSSSAPSVAAFNNYNLNLLDDNVNANAAINQNYNKLMNTTTLVAVGSGIGGSDGGSTSGGVTFNNFPMEQNFIEAKSKMQELQSQLERLERENILLESKVNELAPYQSEVVKLRNEIMKLQSLQEKSNMEISKLKYENESLRNRLRDVVNSPLSDAEKHQIIQDSQRLHSSAPASIALPNVNENDGTPCVTPDWDKNSSSSEISVACLQDKIIQMEETHYSTNEELQATLQELADLQAQLSEIQSENERLSDEKDVLFQSLCRQTEKLNESRTQITTLQELLLRESTQVEINASEREKKLLDLIKNSQDERETILVKQEELNSELNELRQSVECASNDNSRFRERICLLDSTVDAANAERKQIENELQHTKEESSQKSLEISRLTNLLENARSKIDELEQDRARGEKTDLSDLLDASRKEKDLLETRVAALQDQISRSQAEIRKLKDQLSAVTEECKVAKNNAKCALSHLEYRYETLQQEKEKLSADYQQLQDTTAELQVQCKCHLEDKAQLQSLLTETQKHLGEAERKLTEKEEQLQKEIKLRKQEAEEWQQFQSDLLMTVRVANDFKTEALTAREQLVIDNKTQKDKIRLLETQIEKLTKQRAAAYVAPPPETHQTLLSSVQQEMATRRTKIALAKQDSRLSVKTLIESIENNKPQTKSEESESRYSSTSSLNSATSDLNPNFQPASTNIPNEWTENVRIPVSTPATTLNPKGPLREQQQQQSLVSNMHFSSINNVSKSLFTGERKDPLNMLAKNGGSKRNALLKWCQNKTVGYRNIDITNFSSSWNDGLAFCAILHSYLPDRIPYDTLSPANKRRNFSLAFAAAESVGIPTTLNINDMCQIERPDWTQVMTYVTAIYKHFET